MGQRRAPLNEPVVAGKIYANNSIVVPERGALNEPVVAGKICRNSSGVVP